MGRLSPHTINQYRWMLKRYRRILPLMPEDDPERLKLIAKIEKLTNQLGMEMTDLETSIARGPGRPRTEPDLRVYEQALKEVKEQDELTETLQEQETLKAKEVRVKAKLAELRAKVLADNPDLKEAEERSQRELEAMKQIGGGTDEGPKQATDNAKAPGNIDQSGSADQVRSK